MGMSTTGRGKQMDRARMGLLRMAWRLMELVRKAATRTEGIPATIALKVDRTIRVPMARGATVLTQVETATPTAILIVEAPMVMGKRLVLTMVDPATTPRGILIMVALTTAAQMAATTLVVHIATAQVAYLITAPQSSLSPSLPPKLAPSPPSAVQPLAGAALTPLPTRRARHHPKLRPLANHLPDPQPKATEQPSRTVTPSP